MHFGNQQTGSVHPDLFDALQSPIHAFKIDEKKLADLQRKIGEKTEADDEDRQGRTIRCVNCGHKVTRNSYRIEMNGRHRHVFNNPAGYLFEIGCFGAAEGCSNQGTPTLEFTWFSGYSWRYALCAKCGFHLGWLYQSSGGGAFYGLILSHLAEE